MINKGFTLIELMIVVAIIGILAMIATPMYQDYVIRTYVMESISLSLPLKEEILEHYVVHGTPMNDADTRSPTANPTMIFPNKYTESISSSGTNIRILFTNQLAEDPRMPYAELLILPVDGNNKDLFGNTNNPSGSIQWVCLSGPSQNWPLNVKFKYLPTQCRKFLDEQNI